MIDYQIEPNLTTDDFIDVLVRSTLAERRPVDDRDTIQGMLTNADIILTARCDGRLVGVSRAITDRAYCTYLSDLAVDQCFQRQRIGKQLIQRTHESAGLNTTLNYGDWQRARRWFFWTTTRTVMLRTCRSRCLMQGW